VVKGGSSGEDGRRDECAGHPTVNGRVRRDAECLSLSCHSSFDALIEGPIAFAKYDIIKYQEPVIQGLLSRMRARAADRCLTLGRTCM
jgi:hypothetical protein